MKTVAASLPWLSEILDDVARQDLRRPRREVVVRSRGRIRLGERTLLDFSSNDYLGLASDPRLIAAATDALHNSWVGSGASALVTGRTYHHASLERTIAAFEREEDCVLFPTGYAANVGTLAALIRPDDIVFCDRLNHASLVDVCRLSGAGFRVYRSDRLETLERHLAGTPAAGRRWIVTDGVFSMDGTVAPLEVLCELAERYGAGLLVDEAHGTGVLGENGRGACEFAGVEDRVAVRTGTLSKSVGTLGGFVAGSHALVDFLWHHAKSQMFSTALPPAVCAAAKASFEVIQESPDTRRHLQRLSDHLRERLRFAGLRALGDPGVPIVPVVIGEASGAVRVGRELEDEGFLVGAIRPPTVPRGTARLRISVSAVHDMKTVDSLADHVIRRCQSFRIAR